MNSAAQREPDGQTVAARTMRSARIVAPRRVEFITVAVPEPEAGQVRVGPAGCGVCGSNTAVRRGRPGFDICLLPGIPVTKAGALSMNWVAE